MDKRDYHIRSGQKVLDPGPGFLVRRQTLNQLRPLRKVIRSRKACTNEGNHSDLLKLANQIWQESLVIAKFEDGR